MSRAPGSTAVLVLAGLLCLAGESLDVRALVYVAKPLATIVTIVIAVGAAAPVSRRYRALVTAGLVCSLAGDVFLMLPSDRFIAGLASFLVAHLLYIGAFATHGGGVRDWRAAGVFVLAGAMLAVLWPALGALRIPVIAYVSVIAVMGWQALARFHRTGTPSAKLAAMGALSFLVSDSALALRKFRGDFTGSVVVVLGTYWFAQWCIARSVSHSSSEGA